MDHLTPTIRPELLEELLQVAKKPEDLFGPEGLLHFPNDDAVLKILYLALQRAKIHWSTPGHWRTALAHFSILFQDRMPA
jgi:hypothetical protein